MRTWTTRLDLVGGAGLSAQARISPARLKNGRRPGCHPRPNQDLDRVLCGVERPSRRRRRAERDELTMCLETLEAERTSGS